MNLSSLCRFITIASALSLLASAAAASKEDLRKFDAIAQDVARLSKLPNIYDVMVANYKDTKAFERGVRSMILIAFKDLEPKRREIFNRGMEADWVSRLENIPRSPDDWSAANEPDRSLTQLMIAGEKLPGDIQHLPGHFVQRMMLDQCLACHFFIKTINYSKARRYLESSNQYLSMVQRHFPDVLEELKLTEAISGISNQNRQIAARIADEELRSSRSVSSPRGSPSVPAGSTNAAKKPTLITKTFTVTSDARANQTGNEAGASGESLITVRGDGGAFTVRYWYDWPSSYLISAARDKTLVGKSVTIEFDGDKAKYISCGAGNGKCQVKSFSH